MSGTESNSRIAVYLRDLIAHETTHHRVLLPITYIPTPIERRDGLLTYQEPGNQAKDELPLTSAEVTVDTMGVGIRDGEQGVMGILGEVAHYEIAAADGFVSSASICQSSSTIYVGES